MAKSIPGKRKLLSELEGLVHSQRVRRMALLGRDHAETPELRKLLESLDGDIYQWQLRLVAATAARDADDLLVGLSHEMRSVRGSAFAGLRVVGLDQTPPEAIRVDSSAAERDALIRAIRRDRQTELADSLLPQLFERYGDVEAARLLPACSNGVAESWLPRLAHATRQWPALARAHPALFREFLADHMSRSRIERDGWWAKAGAGVAALAENEPSAGLDLWSEFGPETHAPPWLVPKLRRLAKAQPDRTIDLLLRPEARSELARHIRAIRRHLPGATDDSLGRLATAVVDDHVALADVLSRLAPRRRAEIFARAVVGTETARVVWHERLLAVLPHAIRHREARRILELPNLAADEHLRLDVLVSLPLDETWEELRHATTASDAELRAEAYRRLIRAVRYSREPQYFDRLLDELQRLRNEQDPVRLVALQALADCPSSLIERSQLDKIMEIVQFVDEARDTSHATRHSLSHLLQRLLASASTDERRSLLRPAADALAVVFGERRTMPLTELRHGLPRGGEFILIEALHQRLSADARADRFDLVLALAFGLGSRGHDVPQLQALLREATRSKDQRVARNAIALWLAPRGERGWRVGDLVARDPSAALLDPVLRLISAVRQDLLGVVLSSKAPQGRFASARSRQIPLIHSGIGRWTPKQREAYAALLDEAIANEHTGSIRRAAIRSMSRIPEIGEKRVTALLGSQDVDTVEAALSSLTRAERPGEALETLLSYANSDRARVAIYAAAGAARFVSPEGIDLPLRRVLSADDSRLTARKEVVRILGRNRTPMGLETLANLWSARPLHRDLVIALASALRNYPTEELTWEVLGAMAAGSEDEAYALSQSIDPLSWPESARQRLASLIAPLVKHESWFVRTSAWDRLSRWRPWFDGIDALIADAIGDLSTTADWRLAVRQLHLVLDGHDGSTALLPGTISTLISQTPPAGSEAGPDRDRPIEQRLHAIAATTPATQQARTAFTETATRLVEVGRSTAALEFILAGADWTDPTRALSEVAAIGESQPECVATIADVVGRALSSSTVVGRWEPDDLLAMAQQFSHGNEAHALVAAPVAGAAGPRSGWSDEWRAVLRELRSHPSSWVRARSSATLSATE